MENTLKPKLDDLVQATPNAIWIGETGFQADADKLIIRVDEFRSGMECLTCLAHDIRMVSSDKQVSFVPCKECDGKGKRQKAGNKNIEVKCSECEGLGAVPCPDCGGRGGIIAIPQKEESAPTTGKIVSIGPDVPAGKRAIGDRVMFGSYSGNRYDVAGKRSDGKEEEVELRIIRDSEVLCRIYGILQYRALKRSAALHTVA